MPVNAPTNEKEILPTLQKERQDAYMDLKGKVEKAATRMDAAAVRNKSSAPDTAIFTRLLELNLDAEKDKQAVLVMGDDDRAAQTARLNAINTRTLQTFDAKYPVFTDKNEPDKSKVATAKRNHAAMDALGQEVHGDSLIASGVKSVYDEEKEGWQWSRMGGMLLGGVGFFAVASYIAAAAGAGAGWLGTLAIALLTIAGAVFGGNLMHSLFNPAPAPGTPGADGHAPGHGKAPSCEVAPAQPEYTFKPRSHNTQYIDIVQEGNAPPSLAKGAPQMRVEAAYNDNTQAWEVQNATVYTAGKPQRYGINGVRLIPEKDGTIRLDSEHSIRAFNEIDIQFKTGNDAHLKAALENPRRMDQPECKKSIAHHEEVSRAEILKPSLTPAAPTDPSTNLAPGC